MKNIVELKNKICKKLTKQNCGISDPSLCDKPTCLCSVVAETLAYYRTVIPDPYFKYSIKDFNNLSKDYEQIMDKDVALKAKESLIKYCWDGLALKDVNSMDIEEIDKHSIINKRYDEGKNLVIYASNKDSNQSSKGRTFCAGLVMKEAIKNRLFYKTVNSFTFDWVDFSILNEKVIDKDDPELMNMREADWLVIDDIPKNTRPYLRHRMDSFIMERVRDKLPTIFVCRYDVKEYNSETISGVAMSKIFTDSNTWFVSLQKK